MPDQPLVYDDSQIRRILGKQSDGSSFIKTLRSQGYVFIAPVELAN